MEARAARLLGLLENPASPHVHPYAARAEPFVLYRKQPAASALVVQGAPVTVHRME